MEIPILDSGVSWFQNPNLLLQLRAIWTWIALVVAAVATFSSLIRRLSRVIVRLRRGRSVVSHNSSCSYSSDDESCSSSDGEDDEEEEDDEISTASADDFEESQGQSGHFDDYSSWPMEIARGGSVVKFWDGHERPRWDEIRTVQVASPGMILSAGKAGLKVWDPRTAESECATCHANGPGKVLRIVGEGDGSYRYVGDDVGKLMVVDLRNVKLPLAETCWFEDGTVTGSDGDGLASWCRRNLARRLTQ